jgi:choline dehydrogenase-like flavoprotein
MSRHIYDVCIVGSGAAGGFMAKELTAAGADTILLEAGSKGRLEDLYIHDWAYDLPRHGFGLSKQASLYPDGIASDIEYRGTRVSIDRIRTLGGRTFHWNAVCLRFSRDDFREHSVNGIEDDWPLSYEELAPFYDYAEREMHVFGTRENLAVLPDGNFVAESPPLRCSEVIARRKLAKLESRNIKLVPVRKAVLLTGKKGRGACHYCGHCMDVCDTRAVWSSDVTVIRDALATGKLTLRLNALARQVIVRSDGLVSGVSIIDRVTRKEEEIRARVVVLGCGAVESPRLLLNSNGLANSSDQVGRNLGGHLQWDATGYLKELVGKHTFAGDGMTDHAYIPRSNIDGKARDYVGGFGMQLNYASWQRPHHAKSVDGFGSEYKRRVRELQPAMLQMGGWGKVVGRAENRVLVDQNRKDKFGIPCPIVEFSWSENDIKLYKDMRQNILEIFDVCGTELLMQGGDSPNGFTSHEVGTVRMGRDRKTSVLNSFCQAHDVKNLFVVDGSCFTTFPEKNPTLTIAALSVRSARYIAQRRRVGEL